MSNTRLHSGNPDDMKGPGRADDFKGTLVRARYIPFDFFGKSDRFGWHLGVKLEWELDPGYAWLKWTETILAGPITDYAPGNDPEGVVSVDVASLAKGVVLSREQIVDYEGVYANYQKWEEWDKNPKNKDKTPPMDNKSNWAFFCRQAAAAEYSNWDANITHFEGTYGHWNQLRMYKDNPDRLVLSLTELLKTSAPVKVVSVDVRGDLVAAINTALEATADGVYSAKSNILLNLAMGIFSGSNLKEAVDLTKNVDFLKENWIYNADDKTLTAKE